MKKILSLVFMVAAMMYATSANAQIKFGLKGGLNVTSMSFSEDVFDASNKTGFFVGPMVKVTVPIVGLSFDAAALYDQKEADVKYNIDDEFGKTNVKQQSINIPVNVRYGFGLSSLANVFLFAGPQWGFNVGDKNFDLEKVGNYSLKKSNFSVNVGAGVRRARGAERAAAVVRAGPVRAGRIGAAGAVCVHGAVHSRGGAGRQPVAAASGL